MYEDIITFNPNVPDSHSFRMQMAGISYCDGTYRMVRHNSKKYVFEYVESGSGYYHIDNYKFTPEAGDVYIVPYGSGHEYGSSRDNPWTKYWFNVSGQLVGNLLNAYGMQNVYFFKKYPLRDTFLDGLRQLREQPAKGSTTIGPQIILNIILQLAEHRNYLKEQKTASPAAIKLRLYLERNVFAKALTIDDMCEHIKLSPAQTTRIFESAFGQSPYKYLLNLKIAAAQELLVGSVKSVKEIAFCLGFSDEYYFSNIFKRKTGAAPSHYRTTHMISKESNH